MAACVAAVSSLPAITRTLESLEPFCVDFVKADPVISTVALTASGSFAERARKDYFRIGLPDAVVLAGYDFPAHPGRPMRCTRFWKRGSERRGSKAGRRRIEGLKCSA